MAGLTAFAATLPASRGVKPRSTLYLGSGEAGLPQLTAEHRLRERAGLPGELLDQEALAEAFGMIRPAALLSPGSAEADPLSLSLDLLRAALLRGAILVEDEAVAFDWDLKRASVRLGNGATVEASFIILATGYEMPDFVRADNHRILSSWCIATAPQSSEALWRDRVLIWEASQPYLYARTTDEGRIMVGGEDEETRDPEARERAMPAKIERLVAKMRALWPNGQYVIENAWSAEFGETEDGLPLIGPVPGIQPHPRGVRVWRQRHHLQLHGLSHSRCPRGRRGATLVPGLCPRSRDPLKRANVALQAGVSSDMVDRIPGFRRRGRPVLRRVRNRGRRPLRTSRRAGIGALPQRTAPIWS